jgi:hypothetical protein
MSNLSLSSAKNNMVHGLDLKQLWYGYCSPVDDNHFFGGTYCIHLQKRLLNPDQQKIVDQYFPSNGFFRW